MIIELILNFDFEVQLLIQNCKIIALKIDNFGSPIPSRLIVKVCETIFAFTIIYDNRKIRKF